MKVIIGDGQMRETGFVKGILVFAAALGLTLLAPSSRARGDEIGELKEQLKAQQQLTQQMQERLAQLEARQRIKEKSLTQKIEQVAETAEKQSSGLPDVLKWAEKVKISGDLRYRHEHIDEESAGSARWKNGRDRHRIRARLMLEAFLNDDWSLVFRLASGSAEPTSANQTFDSSFDSKAIWLDLAYFDWHPSSVSGLDVYGGKIKNPFYKVGKNQLIWDGDMTPEGIAASYEIPLGGSDSLRLAGGGFWVDENVGSTSDDIGLWGGQAYWKHTTQNKDTVILGASYFDFSNIEGQGDLPSSWGGKSNFLGNTVSNGTYASNFDLVEVFGEYSTKLGGTPLSLHGNWVKNVAAATSEDTGWLVGLTVGKAKEPGSWQFGYNYRDLEADAVVGALSDSDFIGGGTDGKGHVFGVTYQVAKNVQAGLTYFLNEDTANSQGRDLDYHRLQADLKFKF